MTNSHRTEPDDAFRSGRGDERELKYSRIGIPTRSAWSMTKAFRDGTVLFQLASSPIDLVEAGYGGEVEEDAGSGIQAEKDSLHR